MENNQTTDPETFENLAETVELTELAPTQLGDTLEMPPPAPTQPAPAPETLLPPPTQVAIPLADTQEFITADTPAALPEPQAAPPPAKPRRFWPKSLMGMLENVGDVIDHKLGRTPDPAGGVTTAALIESLKKQIDRLVRNEGRKGFVAPHLIKLKVEWGKHDNAPGSKLKALEHELLAAAIDHINDHRYRTLAPVKVEIESDIFTKAISVLPTFGEFDEELQQRDEARRRQAQGLPPLPATPAPAPVTRDTTLIARITRPGIESHEAKLSLTPGGPRLSVGRGADNPLRLGHSSVSKIHAALKMKSDGTIVLADTGSTNGTFVNGRRLSYGEAHPLEEGDVLGFGEVEVRLRKG